MTIQEFQQLTGFYPSAGFYSFIQGCYYEYSGSKQEFCAAFKENKDGFAEQIARDYNFTSFMAKTEQERRQREAWEALEGEVKQLREALEREQEWKPYEDPHNVRQVDYEHMKASGAKELTDEEARDIIAKEFGFERSKIHIVHEVFKEEINRHSQVRRVGTYSRKPLFDVWDWNYIVFNIRGNCTMGYEMYNGQLLMYWA